MTQSMGLPQYSLPSLALRTHTKPSELRWKARPLHNEGTMLWPPTVTPTQSHREDAQPVCDRVPSDNGAWPHYLTII